MIHRSGLLVALACFAILATAAFIPSGKRHWVTAHTDQWFERHYTAGSGSMPNDCRAESTCYNGGTYATPEAALEDLVDDLEQACRQYPHVAIMIPQVSGPPGSDYTRLDIRTRGVVQELVARGVPCKIQVETRADVVALRGRPDLADVAGYQDDTARRYNYSAEGCAHGTISHVHRTVADGSDEGADRECGWPAVGLCSAGSRAGQWCRCYGTNGQLDGDGTCVDALDTDCPSSACAVTPWNAAWFMTAADASVEAALDDYAQIVVNGRIDTFCDGGVTPVTESDCGEAADPSTENLLPPGQKAWPYVYQNYYDFDYGASSGAPSEFTSYGPAKYTTGATDTTATVASAGWTPNEWAGGKAYIRFSGDSTTWEMRTITENTPDTITVTPAWTSAPVAGTIIGIDDVGHTPAVRAAVSGAIVDLEDTGAQQVMAALPFALAHDLGVPASQLVVALQTKFAYWAVAPPNDGTTYAPCRTSDNSFQGENRFWMPSPAGGAGYCNVTDSHGSQLGNPWPVVGKYEGLWNATARRVLDQIATSYYPLAQFASVSAPGRNKFGTTVGGAGLWDGISSSVQRDARYAGSRYNEISPTASFPFNEPACRDGSDNDGDTLIDLNDPGCSGATDTDETNAAVACANGIDDDSDGAMDWPSDPGCADASDASERSTNECDDGIDNADPEDSLIDMADPGCASIADTDETDVTVACNDGIDNDGDGWTDYGAGRLADPGCSSASDTTETSLVACDDGVNNDVDTVPGLVGDQAFIDLADPGCSSSTDTTEDGFGTKDSGALTVWARDIYYLYEIPVRDAAFQFLVDLGRVEWSELGKGGNLLSDGSSRTEVWSQLGDTAHKFWTYDAGHFWCVYEGCGISGVERDDSGVPEDAFLHVGEATTIRSSLGGGTDYTSTGCAPPAAKTKACRVKITSWSNVAYVYNQNSDAYKTWYATRAIDLLLNSGEDDDYRVQAIFHDAQGETFDNNYDGNGQWAVRVGGHIRSDEVSGSPRIGECEAGYEGTCGGVERISHASQAAAYATWTDSMVENNAYWRDVLARHGAALIINCAGWSDQPGCRARIAAASGSHPEQIPYATITKDQFDVLQDQIQDVAQRPHGVLDWFGNAGTELYPTGAVANPHNYVTGRGRVQMTRYAHYLAMREGAGYPGQSYFDPNETVPGGCSNGSVTGDACLLWQTSFYPDGLVDLGWATTSAPTVVQEAESPPNTCFTSPGVSSNVTYRIYERTYPGGVRVITRPAGGWQCRQESGADFGPVGESLLDLGGTYQVLREDGTLGPPITTLSLYNAEGVILYPTGPPPSTVYADFVATPIQGTTCVAPCAVHFDAIGDGTSLTTDVDTSREFHTMKFRWDFGDPGAGVWTTGSGLGASRNAEEGGIAGHLYETPGTYTVTLDVTAPDGDTGQRQRTVTVTDPSTLTTYCVSTSGTFTGCTGTQITTSDLDSALFTSCNVDAAKVRCRFRGGETFTSSTTGSMGSQAGPGLIDSYGTGQAIFEGPTGAQALATFGPGWTVHNVETRHNANVNINTWTMPITSTATHGVSLIGTRCLGNNNWCASTNSAGTGETGSPYNFAAIDNVMEADDTDVTAQDPGGLFMRHNNLLVMGNSFGGHSDYQSRTVHVYKAVFGHNTYVTDPSDAPTGGIENNMQLRTCDGTAGCGGSIQRSRFVIVADNAFIQSWPGNFPAIRVSDNSTTAPLGSGAGGMRDLIVERNFQTVLDSFSPPTDGGLVGYQIGIDVTVRNNVIDLQGASGSSGLKRIVNVFPSNLISQTGIEVYNNTVYATASGTADLTLCVGGANVVNSLCAGNLAYVPGLDAEAATDGGGWTAADNVFATTMPFIATPPAQGVSRMEDFNINVGSQADAAGYDFSSSSIWNALDAGGCNRSAPWDAGAWQIGATGCLATESLIGINSEKMLAGAEAIIFADAIDNSPQLRHTADPATAREESFFRSYRTNLSTLESGITIPTNNLGWPTVDIPYDNDGGGANPAVVARMDLMSQDSGRPIAYPTGSYTLTFSGTGTVQLTGDGTVTCTGTNPSCAVTITPSSTGVSLWITASDPGNLGDPITDVDLLLPGYTTSDTFYWPTVVRLRPFGFIRTLNAIRVNDYECSNLATGAAQSALATCIHTWATRTQPTGIQASRKGISWEQQIALANAAQIDLWATIPHAADDTYVTNLADMLRADLDGKTYMELSNEVWNGGFAQEQYFGNVGDAASWGNAVPCSSLAPDSAAVAACLDVAARRAYVERAADCADIFDAEFTGADAPRLVKVLGSARGTGDTAALITALASGTYNPTSADFDAMAINVYFDGAGANVTAMLDDTEVNVAALETTIDSEYAAISAAGMEMFAYEGGPIIDGSDATSISANDDARMEGICEDFFALWFANGGGTTGAGFWIRDAENSGLLRYPTQSPTPKWLGYMNAIEAAPQP